MQVLGLVDPANLTMKASTLSLQRQQRLVDRVNQDRFILVSEIAAFFQACPFHGIADLLMNPYMLYIYPSFILLQH